MAATLNARVRDGRGKGVARKLRAAGEVPANLYGHGDQNRSLALNALELEKLLHTISVENTVVTLSLGEGGNADVLIREVQMHPFKPEVVHIDFIQLHAGEPIRLQVPVRLTGTPVGVHTGGGMLDQGLHDLEISCLPRDIPEAFELDVSHLDIGDSVRVRDVSLPGVTVLNDEELSIASVLAPTVSADAGTADTGSQTELTRNEGGGE